MGFIVNQALESPSVARFFEQLEIITQQEEVPDSIASQFLHTGGPVEPGRGFVLHSPDYNSDSTIKIGSQFCPHGDPGNFAGNRDRQGTR